MSGARQIVPLRDGSLWIRDLTGRHLRSVTPDGIIDTINPNFETSANNRLKTDLKRTPLDSGQLTLAAKRLRLAGTTREERRLAASSYIDSLLTIGGSGPRP